MNAAAALHLIQALDALLTVAQTAGINIEKFQALRKGGPLTQAQLQELADDFARNLAKL
jgi:hypothetical protein